jgi:hypothetical protein
VGDDLKTIRPRVASHPLVETHKADAFFSYKHVRAYQPLNTYWAEQSISSAAVLDFVATTCSN